MQILRIKWRNFNSYGNKWNDIDLTQSDSAFIQITGGNGNGKCLNPNTKIDVEMDDEIKQKFLKYLQHLPNPLNI